MTKLKKLYLLVDTSTGLEAVARDTKFLRTLESSTTEIHEGYFVTKEQLEDVFQAGIAYRASMVNNMPKAKSCDKYLKKLGVE